MFVKVTQYAEHRNVSQRRVRQWIQEGKIRRNSWKWKGKQYRIDQEKADRDLSENLDQIHNPLHNRKQKQEPMPEVWFYRGKDRNTAERIHVQEQAADVASEGEEPFPGGYTHPWAIWAARYVGELFLLSPDRVEIEQITKTEWRLNVHDLDNESGEPCPWTVDLTFDFHPDQAEG